jgi:NAD(P)H-nitrite reductase large subunit
MSNSKNTVKFGGVTDAVIIGGGVLGLEAAWDIKKAVTNVTIIERSDGLMSRQLDESGSIAIKKAADELGIKVAFEADTDSIVSANADPAKGSSGTVTGVKLKSGELINAQLVIISTGIKQNTELLKDIPGAEITRSIVVNDKMETGVPGIYAIGDCAESGGVNFGIWPQALDMAKTAVANIFGEEKHYKPTIPANMVGLSNIKLYAIGDNGKKDDVAYDLYEKTDPETGNIERFYFVDDKLVGGTLIGDISKLNKLQEAFNNNKTKDEFLGEIS